MAILLLAATAAVGAGQSKNNTTTIDHAEPVTEEVRLDPAAVHEAIVEGEPFDLPVPNGSVEVQATERTQQTIRYQNAAGDDVIVRPPNVWKTQSTDGNAHGLVLSFNHTLHAWLTDGTHAAFIEPASAAPGTSTDEVYTVAGDPLQRILDEEGSSTETTSDGDVGTQTHIKVYFDVYAYVDTEYRNQYGSCCWADQVDYILSLLNNYFDDVELEYRYCGGEVDSGFSSTDMDTAWDRLVNKPYNGCDVKSHWSYKDFDGCEVGKAAFPGTIMLIQHQPDDCHDNERPSSDAQRAYLTAHELGKNNDAWSGDHWSETTLTLHEHRSIMDASLWGHYHECWSQANLDAMATWLGTSVVESPC